MRYEVALNIRFLSAGIYTAGAYIYRKENGSKELIKVGSLYLHAKSKRQAAITTINTILNEVNENSAVTFRGKQLGTKLAELVTHHLKDVLAAKQLYVFIHHNELKNELEELNALSQDAADRKSSLTAAIL
jgi:hypothetical protein